MKVYGYLRVSTDSQEIKSQRLGLLEYANSNILVPVEIVEEVASRATDWRKRALAPLLEACEKGDVILTPEFTRLGGSPGQVFSFLEAAAKKGVVVHITKTRTVMDGSMQSQLLATVFSMASLIELQFIQARTKEGLQRARLAGKILGRPRGQSKALKLDPQIDEIRGYLAIGLSRRKIAKRLAVSYNTLTRFIAARQTQFATNGNGKVLTADA